METLATLLEKIRKYNKEDLSIIEKAYEYADKLHAGQMRESGEKYISHPLAVAHILADMCADTSMICAALLHDTIEDTDITKVTIGEQFGGEIADLVDGVTKISRLNFSTKEEQNFANTRKIIASIIDDIRIIIIKLADRLHNMRTLQYKKPQKQKENSIETMEIFVPLANRVGAYRIMEELQDLAFKYLKPDEYNHIKQRVSCFENEVNSCVKEMLGVIDNMLNDRSIPHELKVRIKNIYGVYRKINQGKKIIDIEDLVAIKIIVEEVMDCYLALGLVHSKYPNIGYTFRDYISNPKTNCYRSLHSVVFGPDGHIVQNQIRTSKMEQVASYGLTAYFYQNGEHSREKMQQDISRFPFYNDINDINNLACKDSTFIEQVKQEVFTDNIYVYGPKGDIIELPKGSTPIDFAYLMGEEEGNCMVAAIINEQYVNLDYVLKDKDRIRIVMDPLSYGPDRAWTDIAHTLHAKRKILDFYRRYRGDSNNE